MELLETFNDLIEHGDGCFLSFWWVPSATQF